MIVSIACESLPCPSSCQNPIAAASVALKRLIGKSGLSDKLDSISISSAETVSDGVAFTADITMRDMQESEVESELGAIGLSVVG